jgi:hypothetical protein
MRGRERGHVKANKPMAPRSPLPQALGLYLWGRWREMFIFYFIGGVRYYKYIFKSL